MEEEGKSERRDGGEGRRIEMEGEKDGGKG